MTLLASPRNSESAYETFRHNATDNQQKFWNSPITSPPYDAADTCFDVTYLLLLLLLKLVSISIGLGNRRAQQSLG